ncbi:hypothetical protein D9619_007807 [Psilocybe cf. subviscida]|uniref:Uncharacterized protein n=1 Tax=Psilocybe cf. subviscida TaxID=2480587 RepID=A0A8H5ESU0_9AGAR|nr:hypothetical protein D9619_007807 [Psilocybe cf. subviscida]
MLEMSSGINVVQARAEKRPLLVTLNRHNISAAGQELLDISEESKPVLYCKGHGDQEENPVRLQYMHGSDGKFPPNTRGFLYHVREDHRRHIRFRLCTSADDFRQGTDLVRPNGRRWKLSWESMAGMLKAYAPLLQMIQDENMASIEEIDNLIYAQRLVATLSPQHFLPKGQSVMDISGRTRAYPNFSGRNQQLYYAYNNQTANQIPYPADTKGVYYYRQSKTAPTLGELRFRLCSNVQSFEDGSDLCVPSGMPWRVSFHHILTTPGFRAIRDQVIRDGLVKKPLPSFVEHATIPIQASLHQPFVVELSTLRFHLHFQIGTVVKSCWIANVFNLHQRSGAYRGRAIVQFEQYPTQEGHEPIAKRPPLLALRFLEFLTPVEMTGKGDKSAMPYPEVGQLLFRRGQQGEYRPWGYSPRSQSMREVLKAFVEQSPPRD